MSDTESEKSVSVNEVTSGSDAPEKSNAGPLTKLRFSVKHALTGRFFKMLYSGEELTHEISTTKSITAVCLKCLEIPTVSQKQREIKVSILTVSNLKTHLARHHDHDILIEFQNDLATVREDFVLKNPNRSSETRFRPSSSLSLRQAHFDQLMVDYVIHAMIPLQSVDDPAFKEIFNFLQISKIGLKVMSRRKLGRKLDESHHKHVENVTEIFKNVDWICTTADIWSGRKRSFIGVTAHWIDDENRRKCVALACRRFKGAHTYDRIATILEEIYDKYGLPVGKVIATITDNGSNFVKAFRIYGVQQRFLTECVEDMYDEADDGDIGDSEDDTENWVSVEDEVIARLPFHLRCAVHTLALCPSSDIPKVIQSNPSLLTLHTSVMEKCNSIWRLTTRPKSVEVIEKITGKSLSRPIETRWNSLYDALREITRIKPHLEEMQHTLNVTCTFTEEEFLYIQEFIKCAEPVAEAIDKLQGEHEAYYGVLVPTLLALRKHLEKLAQVDLIYCSLIAKEYLHSVQTRFKGFYHFDTVDGKDAAIAALSFPRFKKIWFPCINQFNREALLNHFKLIIYEGLNQQMSETSQDSQPMDVDHPLGDFYDFGDEGETESPPQDNLMVKAEGIMNEYFKNKKTGVEMLNEYPTIMRIFKKYNTPLPSSAQVERLFSYATMTNTPKSNRLSDEKFEQRVLLRANANAKF